MNRPLLGRAFAKINLTLRVLDRRDDGFHELRTVFQSLALHDTLVVEPAPGPFRIVCSDPNCPGDEGNLVWRAAEALARHAKRRGAMRGLRVRITKRIPLESGLGGGSSDAAAALRLLSSAWRLTMRPEELRAIGATLGADVPYFVEGGTSLGLDRGDLLFPLADLPSAWVVLVVPAFGVSTKDAYGWFDASAGVRAGPRLGPASRRANQARRVDTPFDPPIPAGELRNDLEPPVVAHHPEIGRVVAGLVRAGADYAAMSGSGSAVFGLFGSRRAAAAAAGRSGGVGRRVVLTRTVGRAEYAARARG